MPRTVTQWRRAVLCVAVVTTTLKLAIAASTYGTNDVTSWASFAEGVREHGPVGLYGEQFYSQYNHPPLSGWMLMVVNWLVDLDVAGLPFLIRVPACIADLITGVVVFELVRRWRSPRSAAIASCLLVSNPALFVISGFHGNTDSLFVMFALVSVYLVAGRGMTGRWAVLSIAAAGAAFAAAMSVKLVPVVLGPVFLVALARQGRDRLIVFAAGASALFVPLWGPVLLTRRSEFIENVLVYPGVDVRQWGLVQFADWLGASQGVIDAMVTPGRFVVLLLSGVLPAVLLWRNALGVAPAVGLALVLFLLLSPAFGMQYLIWPLAGAYFVSTWAATVYGMAISLFTVVVYDHWNHAYPWNWDVALARGMRPKELVLMVFAWSALAIVAMVGLASRREGADRVGARCRTTIISEG